MAALKGNGINPVSLFQKMEQLLPSNSIIDSDGGDFAATSSYILHPRKPLGWLDSGVFGTLGVGAGFALGLPYAIRGIMFLLFMEMAAPVIV